MKILTSVATKPGRLITLSALALALGSTHAFAADAFSYDSPYMLGDWGGLRTDLEKGRG